MASPNPPCLAGYGYPQSVERAVHTSRAAARGDMDTVEFLVSHSAEVNARTKDAETPLDDALHVGFFDNDASKAGKAKIVPFLRGHGGKSGKELQ